MGGGGGGGLLGGGGGVGGCDGGCDGGGGEGDGGGRSMREPSARISTPTTSGCGAGSNSPMDALEIATTVRTVTLPIMNAPSEPNGAGASAARTSSHSDW